MLAGAPPRLAELTAGLKPEALTTGPAPDEWSANDVLAHLRACSDMWGGSIATLLSEDHPTIRSVNPRAGSSIRTTRNARSGRRSARTRGNATSCRAPRAADAGRLGPIGNVHGAGKPIDRTVLSQAQRIAVHERAHLVQIARLADGIRA